MSHRLTVLEVAEEEGFESEGHILAHYMFNGVVPACCSEGCQVEEDGECEHGHPSIFLAMGLI